MSLLKLMTGALSGLLVATAISAETSVVAPPDIADVVPGLYETLCPPGTRIDASTVTTRPLGPQGADHWVVDTSELWCRGSGGLSDSQVFGGSAGSDVLVLTADGTVVMRRMAQAFTIENGTLSLFLHDAACDRDARPCRLEWRP